MTDRPDRGGPGRPDEETLAAGLRAALARGARDLHPVEVPDPAGLAAILARTAAAPAPPRRRGAGGARSGGPTVGTGRAGGARLLPPGPRRWALPVAVAAAVAAVLLLALPGVLRGPAPRPVPPAVGLAPAPLPVYFAERGTPGWRLVREYSRTTETDPARRVEAAVRLAVSGRAADPDRTSAWRASGTPASATGDAQVRAAVGPARIELLLDPRLFTAVGPDGSGPDLARIAVQQLVWTATAAAGRTVPVQIGGTDGSSPPTLFGTAPLSPAPTRPGAADDPRAPIWVSSLTDGERVAAGREIRVTGDAGVPSGSSGAVPRWQLRRSGGSVLADAAVTLATEQTPPARTLWEVRLPPLDPGEYVLSVSYRDWTDTKRLVVSAS